MQETSDEPAAESPATERRDPNFVHALAKGLELLALFSDGRQLGNQELVQRTGWPKATVSRLTSTLVQLGYLRTDPATRKLAMGTRMLGIGARVQRDIGLQQVARPFMERLSCGTGMTVSYGTRDRLGLVFLEVARPPESEHLIINTGPGSVLPLASTAIGLAYLVAAPVRERELIIKALSKRHADEWDALRQNIEQAHHDYLRQGFVVAQRSWGRNVSAVGVPLLVPQSRALYAFHCAGPSSMMSIVHIRRAVGPQLVAAVSAIARRLVDGRYPELQSLGDYQP